MTKSKKKYIYKIKDLPTDFNLVGCKLGKRYIYSGWNKGFWLSDRPRDFDSGSYKVDPIFFKSFEDIQDWKVEVPAGRVLQIEATK